MDGLIAEFDNHEAYFQWRIKQKNWADALDPFGVSGRLGITPEAVYMAMSRGSIRYVRVKGSRKDTRLYIPLWSVEEYEKRGRVASRLGKAQS